MTLYVKKAAVWEPVPNLLVRQGSAWSPVRRGFVRQGGAWKQYFQDETVVTLADATQILLKDYFSVEDWANPLVRKRVLVPRGVRIEGGAGAAIYPTDTASGQAGSWAGELILENDGYILGLGGAPNGGTGGDAIYMNFPGRNGEKLKIINTYGIYAGGGGGGKGGTGGPGYYNYTATQGPYGKNSSYEYTYQTGSTGGDTTYLYRIKWAGSWIRNTGFYEGATYLNSITVGSYTYHRGATGGSISRTYTATAYTTGGAGGAGGRGQGSDGSAASGSAGANGGTNAGKGGTGGAGGDWGEAGATGGTGAAGNNGSGSAGSAGGQPGYAIYNSGYADLDNQNSVKGRVG